MKLIYQTVHDGVIGQIIEPEGIDPSRSYAEQLQVKIGVDDDGKHLSTDEFEPRARRVVLELLNYLRDEYGMEHMPDDDEDAAGPVGPAGATAAEASEGNGHGTIPPESQSADVPTLIHSIKGPRWRIDVHRPEGESDPETSIIFLTGHMGGNVYRSRQMPISLFRELTLCLEHARLKTPELLRKARKKKVPEYPSSLASELARSNIFYVSVAICSREGRLEPTLALYDAEDDEAPVLIAEDIEEIEALCHDCKAAAAAAAAPRA
jgi:hypothetical protein